MLQLFSAYFLIHCVLDKILHAFRIRNPYYLLQSIHHTTISILTVTFVFQTIKNMYYLSPYSYSLPAIVMSAAFHTYHLVMYYRIFQLDDWFHIIERLIISLPLGLYYQSPCLIGYHLFFLSAPFGFDFMSLFIYQNHWCTQLQDKYTNRLLNKWIRFPSCYLYYLITISYLYRQTTRYDELWWSGICSMVIMYNNRFYIARHRRECYFAGQTKLE